MKILDATAGHRHLWIEKDCPWATFMDIRPEVKPTVVASAIKTPFPAGTFDMIVFDPPHKNMGKIETAKSPKTIEMIDRYGSMDRQQRNEFVKGAFIEFKRILKDDGILIFKWSSCGTKLSKIMPLTSTFIPMFGQNFSKSNSVFISNITTWLIMRKNMRGTQRYIY